jgi:hypothetical protein
MTDMSILTTLTHPQDPRWHGPQRFYLAIHLTKTLLLIPFCILVIVETTLFHSWFNYSYYGIDDSA